MSEKYNISSLFDVSGNLTLAAMDRYLRNELSQEEYALVEKHLADSEFDREALEGLKKQTSNDLRKELKVLQRNILFAATKRTKTGNFRISGKSFWYAAASLAGLIGLSVLMFFMFWNPVNKTQLAVMQTDKIIDSTTAQVGLKENSRITEKETIPVTEQNREITSTVNPSPERSSGLEKITPEPMQPVIQLELVEDNQPDIIDDDISVKVEADMVTEFQNAGGIAITDNNKANEEYLNNKGERVTTNYPVQVQSAMTEYNASIIEQQPDSIGVFAIVENMPVFPGGDTALVRFLTDNSHYPDSAREASIQGRVFITFVVNEDGSISDVRILRGIGGGCDEEALRVVKSMPNWIPGKQRGNPVRVQYNLPIKFSLE